MKPKPQSNTRLADPASTRAQGHDLERDLLEDDVVHRTGPRRLTPRRYEQRAEDAAMPPNESSLNTKI